MEAEGMGSAFFDYDAAAAGRSGTLVFLPDGDERDWEVLLGYTERRRFSAGEVVLRRGDPDRALYLLTAGTLEGRIGVGSPTTIEAPTVVGEVAFLDGAGRSIDLVALTDGELRRLTLDAFEALSARYPRLAREVLLDLGRIVATRLRRLTDRVAL